MPHWTICEAYVAGPFDTDQEAHGLAAYAVDAGCPFAHLVIQAAEKPILVDVTAELV